APPPLPDHRRRRGDPDPPSRAATVRVRPPAMTADQLADRLADVLAPALGPVAVEDLRALTGGASRVTWAFDAVTDAHQRRPLILRTGPLEELYASMELEANAQRVAGQAGAPVPNVLVADNSPAALGN